MRFMILRRADKKTEAGMVPAKELLEAMGKYMEEMEQAGVLRSAEGLQASSNGVRIRFANGKPKVIEGPFADTRELIAGFCIIVVKSKEEAIQWGERWPAIDADGSVELEIRKLHEEEDFGANFTPELRQQEQELRKKIAGKQ